MGGSDGRHWEGELVPRNVALADAYERGFPISTAIPKAMAFGVDRHAYNQLSPNQWKMGIGAELCRAAAWGTTAEYEAASASIDAWLDQEEHAWWTIEQCAGGSHDGYHASGELLATVGAAKKQDAQLLARLERQNQRTLAVAMHTSTPGGCCVCIGERPGPVLVHLSALGRIAAGMPHRGGLQRDPAAIYNDPYRTPERLATKLHADGHYQRPDPLAPLPPMRRKLTVYTWGDGFLTVMAAGAGRPLAWAKVQSRLIEQWENAPKGRAATGVLYDTTGVLTVPGVPNGAKKVESGRST